MGDNNGCLLAYNFRHGVLDNFLTLTVEGTCCLIENHDRSTFKYRSSDYYSLLLSATQFNASFTNNRVITFWEFLYEFLCVSGFSCVLNVSVGRFTVKVCNIFPYCPVE